MAKRAKTAAGARATSRPWWLGAGEEDCPHCEGSYVYHVEARCVECDAPICPMCVVHVAGRRLCPDCREERKVG